MRQLGNGLHLALALGLAFVATACFIKLTLIDTFFDDIGQFVRAAIEGESDVALCRKRFESEAALLECTYDFEESGKTATSTLLREYGVFGLLVDPLVLQVQDDVFDVSGTWDDGANGGPLVVTQTPSFRVDAFTDAAAEPGQTFLIFELPQAVARSLPQGPDERAEFSFTASFKLPATEAAPFDVKPMLTVRVDVAGEAFYVPQIPCTSDFAAVPAVTIPVPATDLDLGAAISAAFAGVTGCNGAFYDFSGLRLDHPEYLFWKSKSDAKPAGALAVTDALGSRDVNLQKSTQLGAPANRNQTDPAAPLTPDHFTAYKVKPSPGQAKEPARKGVEVANLLGSQLLDLKKIDLLLLPAAADPDAPVPPLAAPVVKPFLCRKAKYAKGSVRLPKGQQDLVADPYSNATYVLKKPTRFCLPADVDGADATAPDDPVALLCWKAKPTKPRPGGRDGFHTSDQGGSQILRLKKPGELCLPSTFLL